MTGGTVPLSATLASKSVFEVFSGDSKVKSHCISFPGMYFIYIYIMIYFALLLPWFQLKALLHGHSYTAHSIGCSAAVKSIQWFKNPQTNKNMLPGGKSLREVSLTRLNKP